MSRGGAVWWQRKVHTLSGVAVMMLAMFDHTRYASRIILSDLLWGVISSFFLFV
jgi:hypothetical protein